MKANDRKNNFRKNDSFEKNFFEQKAKALNARGLDRQLPPFHHNVQDLNSKPVDSLKQNSLAKTQNIE